MGEQLTKRSMDLGLTRRQAAQTFGVWDQALRNWEAGRTMPGPKRLVAIRIFLEVEPIGQDEALGYRLRAWRRAHSVSKAKAARLCGLHEQTPAHIERGRGRWISAGGKTAIAGLLEQSPAGGPP